MIRYILDITQFKDGLKKMLYLNLIKMIINLNGHFLYNLYIFVLIKHVVT